MNYLKKGDIIRKNGDWLLIDFSDEVCLFVLLNTTKTRLKCLSTTTVLGLVESEDVELIPNDTKDDNIVSFVEFGASTKLNERMRAMAKDILAKDKNLLWLCDTSVRADFLRTMAKKYQVSLATSRRFLRDYLQHNLSLRKIGCNYFKCGGKGKTRVFSEKKAGRRGISQVARTQEVVEQFETMKKRYLKAKARVNFTSLYYDFCQKYYCEEKVVNGSVTYVPCAAAKRPTKHQLYYYIKTHLEDAEVYKADFGKQNARNNIRAIRSDTIADLSLKTIGTKAELDEMETDFYLISRDDPTKVIGRAILYVMVDVYSKIIMGVSVGLENNSWNGVKMVLLNLAENKVELCKRAGIDISEEDWPVSSIIPSEIEVDNGSEYLGNQFDRFVAENGIHLMFVPPRMGSLKPNVEQKFHQFNSYVKGRLPGEISMKDYGKPHVKGAVLTIEDFYKIVLNFVVSYNKTPLTDYAADKDIFESGILPSPLNIWKHKNQGVVGYKCIASMDEYKFSLLTPGKAAITRRGIEFKKIIYICDNQDWLTHKQQNTIFNGREYLEIRYDNRNMDFIYFIADGKYVKAWISPEYTVNEKYKGCSCKEVEAINHKLRLQKKEIEEARLAERINFNKKTDAIVRNAKRNHRGQTNSTENIRENREEEKRKLAGEAQIYIETKNELPNEQLQQIETQEHSSESEIEAKDVTKMSRMELFAYMEDMKLKKLGL